MGNNPAVAAARERLNAAAPALLAACKAALEFFEQPHEEGTLALRLAGVGGLFVAHQLRNALAGLEGING